MADVKQRVYHHYNDVAIFLKSLKISIIKIYFANLFLLVSTHHNHIVLSISNRILPCLSLENNSCKASLALSSLNLFHTLTLSSPDMSTRSLNSFLLPPVDPINFICLEYKD